MVWESVHAHIQKRSSPETERTFVVARGHGEVTMESHFLTGPGWSCEGMKASQSYIEMLMAQ